MDTAPGGEGTARLLCPSRHAGPIPQQKHNSVLHPPFMPSRSALPDHCGRRRIAWRPFLLVATLTGPWHKSRTVAGWQLLAKGRGPAPAWLWAPTAGAGPPPMPEQHLTPSARRTHGIIESFRLEKIHKISKAKHHLTLLSLLLNHVPKHNLQGWQFHHFPEQPAPMPNHSFHEEIPLVSNPTLHWNNSKPLPCVLSLITHDKRPAVQGHITVIVTGTNTWHCLHHCTAHSRPCLETWVHINAQQKDNLEVAPK